MIQSLQAISLSSGRFTPQFGASAQKNVLDLIQPQRMADTFIKMARIDSASRENATSFPSSPGQRTMADFLVRELGEIGLSDINVDQHGVVTASLNPPFIARLTRIGKPFPQDPVIGLIAHMDTSNDSPTRDIQPRVHRNYQGGDIVLEAGTRIPAEQLKPYQGEDIITSDGRTLLGGDDKAGIAEILEALRVYKENPDLKHPRIKVAFTPDEETSEFIEHFDTKAFGAHAAYTLDGDVPNVVEAESFNAHKLDITITGRDVHPGYAKGKMVNAVKIAQQFIQNLPADQCPESTEGRQGYFHVLESNATPGQAKLTMIVRDFDYEASKQRVETVKGMLEALEAEHPGCTIQVSTKEQYRNMADHMEGAEHVVEYAMEGLRRGGLTPALHSIRGGTDGCNLTQRGLPTPNLGAGEHNFHAKNEFVTIQEMARCAANIINTLSVWVEKDN